MGEAGADDGGSRAPAHPAGGRLILASASPRRQSLLAEAGYTFTVHPADVDESVYPPELNASRLAEFLAVLKATAVRKLYPHDVTLAADTVVALGDQVLGKPADATHARAMLQSLSDTTHSVITGVAVSCPAKGFLRSTVITSTVQMRVLTPDEIDAYVAGGEWRGKAGGYGIQDADPFVTRTAGSHTNIVGLPMEAVAELLADAGIRPRG